MITTSLTLVGLSLGAVLATAIEPPFSFPTSEEISSNDSATQPHLVLVTPGSNGSNISGSMWVEQLPIRQFHGVPSALVQGVGSDIMTGTSSAVQDGGPIQFADGSTPQASPVNTNGRAILFDSNHSLGLMGVRNSALDLGEATRSSLPVTVTFYMRATESTNGFVFALQDNVLDGNSSIPDLDLVSSMLFNASSGEATNSLLGASGGAIFGALYASGDAQELRWVTKGGGVAPVVTTSLTGAGDTLFDDQWHVVALTFAPSAGTGTFSVQLFVDGRTSYSQHSFRRCLAHGHAPQAVGKSPLVTPGGSLSVFDDGTLILGHQFNGSLGTFQVHRDVALSPTQQTAMYRDQPQEPDVTFLVMGSVALVLALVFFIAALVNLGGQLGGQRGQRKVPQQIGTAEIKGQKVSP